jgi:hypothetical protein
VLAPVPGDSGEQQLRRLDRIGRIPHGFAEPRTQKSFELASDGTKHLLTLSAAILALTVTLGRAARYRRPVGIGPAEDGKVDTSTSRRMK